MELLNPKITIPNTDQPGWLVRLEHAFSDCEHLDLQLKMQRLPPRDVPEIQRQLLRQTLALLQSILDNHPAPGRPSGG